MKRAALTLALVAIACGGDSTPITPDAAPPVDAAIDATPDADVCATRPPIIAGCNPVTQLGCAEGQKCSVVFEVDGTGPGQTSCVPDGTVEVGGECARAEDPCSGAVPIEFDNCAAGSFCRSGICETICEAAPASCPDPNAQACIRIGNVFTDTATPTGVCAAQCDPNEDTTCGAGEGCYLVGYAGAPDLDFICAAVATGAENLTAGQPCTPTNGAGQCFINSAPPGAMIAVREAQTQGSISVIAPYCRSTTAHTLVADPVAAANGLDGALDGQGATIECAAGNLLSGGTIGGGAGDPPQFGCRDVGSAFGDPNTNPIGTAANDFIGFCVLQDGSDLGGSGWNEASTWVLQDLVDDAADGAIDDPANSLCFGCASAEVLDAAFSAAIGPGLRARVRDRATINFLRSATLAPEPRR